MTKKPLPSIKTLRQALHYDPKTGFLFWKNRPLSHFSGYGGSGCRVRTQSSINRRCAGKRAMACMDKKGYPHGRINGKTFRAHRVIWALVHGEWPSLQIDHINGDKADNRIDNLRCVESYINQQNMKMSSLNKSGCTGVRFVKSSKKWKSEISYRGKSIHIGTFDNFRDAVFARKKAEKKYGYHPNHGRKA